MVSYPPARARLEAAHPADAPDDLPLKARRAEDLVEDDLRVVRDVRVEVNVEAAAIGQEVEEPPRRAVEPREPRVESARVFVGGHRDPGRVVRRAWNRGAKVERAAGVEGRIDVGKRDLAGELGRDGREHVLLVAEDKPVAPGGPAPIAGVVRVVHFVRLEPQAVPGRLDANAVAVLAFPEDLDHGPRSLARSAR